MDMSNSYLKPNRMPGIALVQTNTRETKYTN